MLAFDHRVGKFFHDQLDGAHGVVVAGDGKIDQIRIGIGVDQGDLNIAIVMGEPGSDLVEKA